MKAIYRIGILGDIHGNLEALKVAYSSAIEIGVDKIFHLGDLGGYSPFVNEVVDFLAENSIEGVQGNYDEAVAFNRQNCGCKYENDFQAEMSHLAFEWTKRNANEHSKNYMKNLPFMINLTIDEVKISIFHATPTKNNLYWHENRPEKFFLLMAEKAKANLMIYGHTHIPYVKTIKGLSFVNAGSVGKPKDKDPRTCLCIVEISKSDIGVKFIRKEYDIQKVVNAIVSNGLPYYFAQRLIIGS